MSCHVPGFQNQGRGEILARGPADYLARTSVQFNGQIKPAFSGGDVSDIGHPDLVRPIRGWDFCQPVATQWQIVFALRGWRTKAAFLPGAQATLTHQSGYTVFSAAYSLCSQGDAESRAAISSTTFLEDGFDHFDKLLVPLAPWSLALIPMSVEAAF